MCVFRVFFSLCSRVKILSRFKKSICLSQKSALRNTRLWLLDGRETTAISIRDSCQPRRDISTLLITLVQICYLLHCRPFLIQIPGLGRVLLHQRCRRSFWFLNIISVFLFYFYFSCFPFSCLFKLLCVWILFWNASNISWFRLYPRSKNF